MYVLIDRDNMRFFAKHDDHLVLSYLAEIELAHVAVFICPGDEPRDFNQFTDLELRLLYKHTTGSDHSNAHRPGLLAACASLAQQLPTRTPLNKFELEVQSKALSNDDTGRYLYAPGASRAQRMPDLFEPQMLTCQQGWSAEQLAEFAKRAPQPAAAPAATSTPATQRSPAARPAAGAGAVPAQPRGGGKAVIWAHMDQLWEKAGKPMDVKIVLGLRKVCMDELEALNLAKRTSASSELGNWMKARCPQ